MRTNLPVTNVEHKLREGDFIVSTTDLKGLITYVNPTFLEISGFSERELLGAPHNIVRHPDMPAPAFADLWATLQKGKPWSGLVKNRCKNGDYYWVRANAAPIWQGDSISGYISVRTAPSQTEIDAAEAIYRAVREGRAGKVMVLEGAVVSARAHAKLWRRLTTSTLKARLIALVAIMGGVPLLAGLAPIPSSVASSLAAASLIVGSLIAYWLHREIDRPLAKAVKDMTQISQGHMDVATLAGADNEVGHVLSALKALHIRVGFDLAETKRVAEAALRIKIGLDNVSTGVMIADTERKIIYVNKSVVDILSKAEADIRQQLPNFSASNLVGTNIDGFHQHPAHQAQLLAKLNGTHSAALTIGGRSMVVRASPVINDRGQRLGSVAEWTDRTAEVAVEQEVADLVNAAAAGDFSRRLSPAGKEGFFLQLAEGINKLVETSERGMNDVAAVLAALSEGDLTREMVGDYQGLFAELKDSANTTSSRLREIVGQIREATDAINTAAREIASGNADLSSRTESQASSLEETASSMDELTSTVKQNADNAKQANQLAQGASDIAIRGGEMVGEVVHTMGAIAESSNKIADIISVIDGIAFQTNILALNAAVEAARAGEQGRGFAVVAGEVRNLAQRSAAAAKEIKQLINDSVGKVDAGYKVVEQAGATMQEIVQSVKRVTDIMAEINAASTEQSQGIEQVNAAVSQMDEMTQQNAALVEQAAAAAESLQDQADGLAQAVAVFKIGGGTGMIAAPRPAVARAPQAAKPPARTPARTATSATDEDEWQEF